MMTKNMETMKNEMKNAKINYCGNDGVRFFYKSVDGVVREYVWCIGRTFNKAMYEKDINDIAYYLETGTWKKRKEVTFNREVEWGLDGVRHCSYGVHIFYNHLLKKIAKDIVCECVVNHEFGKKLLEVVDTKAKERDELQAEQWKKEGINKNCFVTRTAVRGRKKRIENGNMDAFADLAEEFELFEICGLEPYNGGVPIDSVISTYPRWYLRADDFARENGGRGLYKHGSKRAMNRKYLISYTSIDGKEREYIWHVSAREDEEMYKQAIKQITELLKSGKLTVKLGNYKSPLTTEYCKMHQKLSSKAKRIFNETILNDISNELAKECYEKEEFGKIIIDAADAYAIQCDKEKTKKYAKSSYYNPYAKKEFRETRNELAGLKRSITRCKRNSCYDFFSSGYTGRAYKQIILLCNLFEITGIRPYKEAQK